MTARMIGEGNDMIEVEAETIAEAEAETGVGIVVEMHTRRMHTCITLYIRI
jgi:hypothetical protein